MDTKLKNSRKIRTILGIFVIIFVTVANFFFFPLIGAKGEQVYEDLKAQEGIDENYIRELVLGTCVLYYEMTADEQEYPYYLDNMMESWQSQFQEYRYYLDYYVHRTEGSYISDTNTLSKLEILLDDKNADDQYIQVLRDQYQSYFVLNYDENGDMSVENVWDYKGREDDLIRILLECDRYNTFQESARSYGYNFTQEHQELDEMESDWDMDLEAFPKNCQVVYGISEDAYSLGGFGDDYWMKMHTYSTYGGSLLYIGTLVVLAVAALFFTSDKIWRKTIDFKRRGPWYLAEAAVAGIFGVLMLHDRFLCVIYGYVAQFGLQDPVYAIQNGNIGIVMNMLELFAGVVLIYAGWYLCTLVIRPVFCLGIREYLRQYSLAYLIFAKGFGWCKRYWNKTKSEMENIDFSNKTIKMIRKIVILNFVVLAVISCFWYFGIFILMIYSVVIFSLIKEQYDKIAQDYQSLKQAATRIASGDLQYEDGLHWGVFEPLKGEFAQIRSGFSKAVEEEVKSQRMKTELITNVSHDLKTPLTAITTYVELLKDDSITAEQRGSYVEILEKKSLQLKVLVEDLFEVSKANSNTIQLDLMEVEVVNLLKQVCVEHEEHFQDKGLSIKWKLPEEKVVLMLDNQKTYRIFENLFVNIEKYAMPNSRVFIEVNTENGVEIVIKNMSAQELNVIGEEITERFVRGDASRTTEGSGLGLAIAKSFTEAQKGTFGVTVDGDLFKVTISW